MYNCTNDLSNTEFVYGVVCVSSTYTLSHTLYSVQRLHSLGFALSNVCTMYIFVRMVVCALFSLSLELSGVLLLCVCLYNLCCCHFDSYATNNLRMMRIHLAFTFFCVCANVWVYESVNEIFFFLPSILASNGFWWICVLGAVLHAKKCVYSSICNRNKAERAACRHFKPDVMSKFMFYYAPKVAKMQKAEMFIRKTWMGKKSELLCNSISIYLCSFPFISTLRFDGAAFLPVPLLL